MNKYTIPILCMKILTHTYKVSKNIIIVVLIDYIFGPEPTLITDREQATASISSTCEKRDPKLSWIEYAVLTITCRVVLSVGLHKQTYLTHFLTKNSTKDIMQFPHNFLLWV